MLTRAGTTPLSRLGASLLGAIGQTGLVCDDTKTYVERAVGLASDPAALAACRQSMAQAIERTRLFDPARVAREIERLSAEIA